MVYCFFRCQAYVHKQHQQIPQKISTLFIHVCLVFRDLRVWIFLLQHAHGETVNWNDETQKASPDRQATPGTASQRDDTCGAVGLSHEGHQKSFIYFRTFRMGLIGSGQLLPQGGALVIRKIPFMGPTHS